MTELLLVATAALIIGFAKTSLGGLAVIAVAIFASTMPARESTGAILAVLLVGDLVACWHYRRDADWTLIRRLLPAVLPGLLLGSAFLGVVDDLTLRRSIGGLLLVLVLLNLWLTLRRRDQPVEHRHAHGPTRARASAWGAGLGVGFATMTANAAGAVMTIYLAASRIDKRTFVGTNAWFFLVVNLVKVPFSVGLGLLHPHDVTRAMVLAPLVIVGALLGYAVVQRLDQARFDMAVLFAGAVAATALIVG